MKIERKWAMPNKWTFTIKPIKELLERYVTNSEGWLDPFAGNNSPAEYTNDINKDCNAKWHYDADFFIRMFNPDEYRFEGCLLDPPYSNEQISRSYKDAGLKAKAIDTGGNFYSRIKDKVSKIIETGGIVISFGWNSVGMGINRGFEIEEILLVCHGGAHNDTIVTVERKINRRLDIKQEK